MEMRTTRNAGSGIEAGVGYAADHRGRGVAYARLAGSEAIQLIRVGFRVGGPTISSERAVAYAALTAIARALVKRGLRDVRFSIGDEGFAEEISSGRGVEERLAIPYVRLRCALNSLANFAVAAGPVDDLTQRARAEAALNVAA
jgi:hypothetical protein